MQSDEYPSSEEPCPHCWDESALRTLPAGKAVPKDDCAYCCHTAQHEGGIFVCAACFVGVCPSHASKHYGLTHHAMYVVVRQLPPPPVAVDAPHDTNMLGIAPPAEFDTSLVCFPCHQQHIPGVGLTFDSFSSIVSTTSVAVSDTIAQNAWFQNRIECPHIVSLVQTASPFGAGVVPDGETKCNSCDSRTNNWMCMTCGNVGCPRKDALGNEHAIMHNMITGHAVVMKLGTATSAGADLYCYACGDEVKDSRLAEHLGIFGIDIRVAKKTSKSLGEMEYERTMQHDFGKITESSVKLVPAFGPGKTGLRNFGNTCYLASVLQCLFTLRPFQLRFSGSHRDTCKAADPYGCYECQTERLAEGLLSGRYSSQDAPEHLRGITPRAFKKLFANGHVDFSTGHQQDAQEFLLFILKEFSRRMPSGVADPSRIVEYVQEERQECSACHGVRYIRSLQPCLSLNLPIQPPSGPSPANLTEEQIDAARPATSLDACLASFLLPSEMQRVCSQCKNAATYHCTNRLASFPDVLAVHVRREYYDRSTQQVRKLDAYVDMPQEVDLIRLRSAGPRTDEGEQLMPEDATENTGAVAKGTAAFVPDELALATMMSMGIEIPQATWALEATNNNVERAIDYFFSHPEGPPAAVATTPEIPPTKSGRGVAQAATDGSPQYRLRSMISHVGSSAVSGHYLCHIYDPSTQKWFIFNDEAVAESQKPPFRMASIYFYTRIGSDV